MPHYDPAIAVPFRLVTPELAEAGQAALWAGYDRLTCPTLLIRGGGSDVVGPAEVEWFRRAVPHAEYVNVAGAVLATRDLQGLSRNTVAATLYYEHEALNGRVSLAKRDRYLTTAVGREGNDMEGTNATTNVDASISYALSDQWKLTFEALNLTDEVDDQWVDSSGNRLTYYHSTGRQYYLGAQYKF